MKLSRKEILKHAENLSDREQGYFHHESCPASHGNTDSKPRLWVKRDGNKCIGYCHHCGLPGYAYQDNFRKTSLASKTRGSSTSSSGPSEGKGSNYQLPKDGTTDTSVWPREAKIWVFQYGITEQEIKQYHVLYSSSMHRIIFPVFRDSVLVGYQTRRVHKEDTYPKYITRRNINPLYYTCSTGSSAVVITEDIISCIKCSRYISSVALMGSTISDELVLYIIDNYSSAKIFMDDDNADIKAKQLKLKKRLELYIPVELITGVGKDPKECTDAELRRLL